MADGKVFVYSNKQPVDGGDGFKLITEATLALLKNKGLSAEELAIAEKQKNVAHTTLAEWAAALRGIKDVQISHHVFASPLLRELWEPSFVWSDTVYCLDAATGKELWKKSFPVDKPTLVSPLIGGHPVQWWIFGGPWGGNLGASGTPTAWGGKVYVVGSAGLYSLSAKDGTLLWQVKSGPEHGFPLVADGIVYHLGVAYDAETGKVRWKNPLWALTDGKHSRNEWVARYFGSGLWMSGGKKYIVTTDGHEENDVSCVCLELETGKVMWTFKGPQSSGFYSIRGELLLADGPANVPVALAFKATPAGVEKEPFWKGRFSSPAISYQDHVYGGNGVLYCASLKTGETTWKKTKFACCAQIVADGKILGSLDSGGVTETVPVGMIRATPDTYEPLGSFNPEAIPLCPVALSNGKLFVRAKDRVACYDVQDHNLYFEGVTATKETLAFRFKQTGGGLGGDPAKLLITAAGGAPTPARVNMDGDNVIVDIKDIPLPFSLSCGANVFVGKNGKPAPAFGWSEARRLKFKKAFDNVIVLTSSEQPLQQHGGWREAPAYMVGGAKVTKAEIDQTGRNLHLTTDKTWRPGDPVKVTYPCFRVDQGEPRRETVSATVAELQGAAAKFVKADSATSGDWKGKYGKEGAMVAGDSKTSEVPICSTIEMRNCTVKQRWAQSEKDSAHLLRTGKDQGRSVEEWHSSDELFIDIECLDGKEHQVAIYVGSRNPAAVEVLDPDTKKIMDTQEVPAGNAVKYLAWNIKGNVTLHAVNLGSAEAAGVYVGGIFIDPPEAK
ncbi:MAG: PQQ-like beta-propeller repeat protein [Planctomycetes bacterium]|nr:PQQ-like beta-propeller repeat protein [Planctomycetota bacterium]